MADEQDSSSSRNEGSPLTRPGFLVAAAVVLVIVVLGVLLAVRVARSDDTITPQPTSTSPQAPSSSTASPPADPSASVCGLSGSADSGGLTSAPAAAWQYEETTAYPTSPEYGPGKTADEGYRYCFQHTPAGAVFATANALAQGTSADVTRIGEWAQYFVSDGSGRGQVLDQLNAPRGDNTGVRMTIVGFKVLSYTADSARVDLAVQTSASAQTVYASAVYELAWQAGDWKLNSDAPAPFNFATIPAIDGYVPWKA